MGAILVSSSVTGTRKSDRSVLQAAGGGCPVSFKYYIFLGNLTSRESDTQIRSSVLDMGEMK